MFDQPIHFDSYLRPMVWGGRRLGDVLGRDLPDAAAYGEAWEISDHASHSSIVAEGPLAGRTLRDLMKSWREPILGAAAARHARFPLLVKLLDADDRLSVQVHPDDESVRRLWPGEGGKTEVWFVLDARPGSRVYAGLKPGIDRARLRTALERGGVADCLHSFEPRAGDCLFLRAGTVHAVGGGVLMAEVQQTSDATFRLYDWDRRDAQGRSRELHVEQALECIDWRQGPVDPIRVEDFGTTPTGPLQRRRLVDCPYFELEYLRSGEPMRLDGEGRPRIVTVIQGAALLGGQLLKVGDTRLIPAELPKVTLTPNPGTGMLISSIPER